MTTMENIEHVKVGAGGASSIVFSNISQGFTDLYLLVSARTDRANVADAVRITANGATGYYIKYIYGSGTGTGSYGYSDLDGLNAVGGNATASAFGNASAFISNYTSTRNKSLSIDGVGENNAAESYQNFTEGQITTTSAITTLTLSPAFGSNFAAGTTATLYGILAGSDGSTTVS